MNNKKEVIEGYGFLDEFDLSNVNATEFIKKAHKNSGEFVKRYEIDESFGGNWTSGGLKGMMYEFENLFFVVWSCGEYIDGAIFRKE